MKKALLLLASVALLLVGCQKEQFSEKAVGEGTENVTFTVGVTPTATRAVADGDGAAAYINHWIMQVLDSDGEVYNYQEKDATAGTLTQTFSVPLIKGQTYQVLFWADTKGNYVVTDLRTVKRAEEVALTANCDDLDAFSAVEPNFSTTQATSKEITLKRPFAQLNVVFTDLDTLYNTMKNADEYAKFITTNFVAKAKVPTTFNVLTQEAGAPAETALEMKAATDYLGNYTTHRAKETLYMDYIFATAGSKDVVDIDFSFVSKGVTIAHNFTAIPFQRNYRTNILGEFMSANATWTVVVDPIWDSLSDGSKDINVDYTEVNEPSEVKDAIKSKTDDPTKTGQGISVIINNEVGAVNDDIIIPDDTPKEKTPEIILDFKKLSAGAQIVIRDEKHPVDQPVAGDAKEYNGEVIVIVPEGTTAQQVNILTDKSTVTVRGEYGTVIASCAPNTIVIEKETVIGTLEVMKGNVEVYGKVTSIVNSTDEDIVYVYMHEGAVWTNLNDEKGEKLVPVYPVAKICSQEYFSLKDAVDAAPANAEINVISDITGDGLQVATGKNFTLNFGGHTYTIDGNTVGSQGTETNGMQLLKGSTLKFVNGKIVSTKAKLLIQNYADLTLENMNLDLSGATQTAKNYVISNNCGNVQILGNTSLKSRATDGVAFDVYYWPTGGYSEGVNVVVNTTGTITGKIEIAHDSVSDEAAAEKSSLKIQNGKFDAFAISAFDGANVEISGGKFSTEPKSNYIIIGKKTVKNGNYYELTDSDNWVDYVKSQPADYVVDNSAKTVTLGSRDALIWFSKQTQSNQGIYPRYTITLTTDVDLSGKYWTPICAWNPDNPLTFDGDNHTVSNMMTRKDGENNNYRSFFGHITADIKNLTMTKANVSGYAYTGVVAGDSYGNFENVHVTNSLVNGSYWCIGGVTGFHDAGNMKNVSVEGTTVNGGCPGGIVGTYNETNNRTYENCTAVKCTLNDTCCWGAPYTYGSIVAVVNASGLTLKNCSSSEMTYHFSSTDKTYVSGDEGTPGAPAHALYGFAEDGDVTVINE